MNMACCSEYICRSLAYARRTGEVSVGCHLASCCLRHGFREHKMDSVHTFGARKAEPPDSRDRKRQHHMTSYTALGTTETSQPRLIGSQERYLP